MISLAFFFNPKISRWRSENIHLVLRNVSCDLAALPKGWNENCCLSSFLLVVWLMGLDVIFLFTGRTRERNREMKTFVLFML